VHLSELPSRYPYVLVTPQYNTERVLSQRAKELGVTIARGLELVAIKQNDHCVEADLRSKGGAIETRQARYLVGADGAHGAVRHELRMPFLGHDSRIASLIITDVRLSETPPGVHRQCDRRRLCVRRGQSVGRSRISACNAARDGTHPTIAHQINR
jgi:2-polyprenyl-6-methoxyphenol hydroxylase-like FAD-dependent oxidoreductase